ncbi:alpha/beta fold hydrolase [Micromonospora sp. DT233]|uniref:alpha/beta fold hydrolase n=1 Tax=Micromonospora sp. DT233 TaxID=3393432 RepID=UPI003CE76F81
MMERNGVEAVTRLAERVLSVRPLAGVLPPPVAVASAAADPAEADAADRLLGRVAERVGAGPFRLLPAGEPAPDVFAAVVARRLDLSASWLRAAAPAAVDPREVAAAADDVVAQSLAAACRRAELVRPDGARLTAYALGDPAAPAVVLASACGMPVQLSERWVRRLAQTHHVVTWESRWLFGPDVAGGGGGPAGDPVAVPAPAVDVAAQAGDLLAVLDHFGVARAHLMGLCGGAVIALDAAVRWPERFTSMSLWHGDFELGPAAPKTDHQRNLQALLDMARQGRDGAAAVHRVLYGSLVDRLPEDLAHLVIYPYATGELWYRYSLLNGAIMTTDVRAQLRRVALPTLVVTSADDATAHPDGSIAVARGLADTTLHIAPHGDHISLFRGPTELIDLALDFLTGSRS